MWIRKEEHRKQRGWITSLHGWDWRLKMKSGKCMDNRSEWRTRMAKGKARQALPWGRTAGQTVVGKQRRWRSVGPESECWGDASKPSSWWTACCTRRIRTAAPRCGCAGAGSTLSAGWTSSHTGCSGMDVHRCARACAASTCAARQTVGCRRRRSMEGCHPPGDCHVRDASDRKLSWTLHCSPHTGAQVVSCHPRPGLRVFAANCCCHPVWEIYDLQQNMEHGTHLSQGWENLFVKTCF